MQADVKICGLMRPEDVSTSIEAGAAYLGFIVEAKSKRRLRVSEAATLAAPIKDIVARVAVTVNAEDNLIAKIINEMSPDYIQCHGDETPQRVAEIAAFFGVKTIKAVSITSDADMKTAETFVGVSDFILLDAKPPKGSDVRGGHGISIDWDIIARAPLPKRFALAGGLTPLNVKAALAKTRAPILDVSSGVEREPGLKDPFKIKAFMKAAGHR